MFTHQVLAPEELLRGIHVVHIPGNENFPCEPEDVKFANTVSTIMVLCVTNPGPTVFSIGGVVPIFCQGTISQGEPGIGELKGLAVTVRNAINKALASDKLGAQEREYFSRMKEDVDEHGLWMPFQGQIPLD